MKIRRPLGVWEWSSNSASPGEGGEGGKGEGGAPPPRRPSKLHSARARQALRPPGPWTNATVQRFRLPGRPKRRARSENEAPNGKSIAFPPRPPQQTTVHVSKISSRSTTVLHFCESDRGMPVPRPAPSAHPRCHTSFANSRALRAIPRACFQLPRLISKVNFANSRALRAIPRACLQLPRLISKVNFANSRALRAIPRARASSCLG